ncbi:HAD-IIIA family hydrolase [Jiangella aurantiaca]|uniref:D,D-heptose 1,7-bisphosphate phosphatase n=1 Tax=Jiangella aurantiaca TaxID=2530373 RepID=A0A4R5AB32_9ACTN|nr:HAD-IIIA family hydrolase [Jiangella aurantiaca]TDD69538.1 HAD-IIIA family hydrolase [Jiangella aurantiaca]
MAVLPTTVVVPTIGRPSLDVLLRSLRESAGPRPADVIVVDDSETRSGPAAARNRGWRRARTPWVSFLDDDVIAEPDWLARLAGDIAAAGPDVAGSQGHVTVPLPARRRPTDWERGTAGLQDARWITADMSYRRSALVAAGGFDERFPRAYREDADLALRVQDAGGRLVHGRRGVVHPVRPAGFWASVRAQAGNADDVLMRRLHGPDWRERAGAGPGRRRAHLATTAAAAGALALAATGQRRAAGAAAAGWLAATARFAGRRIAPGPGDPAELARMLLTSAVIPPAAAWHAAAGWLRHRGAGPWRGVPDLVLLDRDGTLIHDVPYNGDPERVEPLPGAADALDRLRAAGVRVGVVTNQSGIARGLLTEDDVERVGKRVEQLLGPFDVWRSCPHGPDDGCGCRKPAPGMVASACAELGVPPDRCVVIGDIGADVAAAEAAGATGVLVPGPQTRPEEVAAARHTAPDLGTAADALLGGAW